MTSTLSRNSWYCASHESSDFLSSVLIKYTSLPYYDHFSSFHNYHHDINYHLANKNVFMWLITLNCWLNWSFTELIPHGFQCWIWRSTALRDIMIMIRMIFNRTLIIHRRFFYKSNTINGSFRLAPSSAYLPFCVRAACTHRGLSVWNGVARSENRRPAQAVLLFFAIMWRTEFTWTIIRVRLATPNYSGALL